jgi:hypothetical protein
MCVLIFLAALNGCDGPEPRGAREVPVGGRTAPDATAPAGPSEKIPMH